MSGTNDLPAAEPSARRSQQSCALCGAGFVCGAEPGDRFQCWCTQVAVDAELTTFLKAQKTFVGCLCPSCLGGDVPSPCRSICELDDSGERCSACHRSLDEIGAWTTLSAVDRARTWLRLNAAERDA
ncbi:MAG: cysteine-rich CWC family protein [Pseudomonadota bacterium]